MTFQSYRYSRPYDGPMGIFEGYGQFDNRDLDHNYDVLDRHYEHPLNRYDDDLAWNRMRLDDDLYLDFDEEVEEVRVQDVEDREDAMWAAQPFRNPKRPSRGTERYLNRDYPKRDRRKRKTLQMKRREQWTIYW